MASKFEGCVLQVSSGGRLGCLIEIKQASSTQIGSSAVVKPNGVPKSCLLKACSAHVGPNSLRTILGSTENLDPHSVWVLLAASAPVKSRRDPIRVAKKAAVDFSATAGSVIGLLLSATNAFFQ
jgi:hypothetical protein